MPPPLTPPWLFPFTFHPQQRLIISRRDVAFQTVADSRTQWNISSSVSKDSSFRKDRLSTRWMGNGGRAAGRTNHWRVREEWEAGNQGTAIKISDKKILNFDTNWKLPNYSLKKNVKRLDEKEEVSVLPKKQVSCKLITFASVFYLQWKDFVLCLH